MKKIQSLTIVWLAAVACAPALSWAQVDRARGGVVSAEALTDRYTVQTADPGNVQLVPDPTGSGRTVVSMRVRAADPRVHGGSRTEIVPKKEYVRSGIRWYAMSFYLPADWQFHNIRTAVGQIHTSQRKAVLSPPLALVIQGRQLELALNFNVRAIEGPEPATKKNSTRQTVSLGAVNTEQWYCFVVRADWSHKSGEGSLEVWMNGKKVYVKYHSPNAYETWLGNYPKTGLYIPGTMPVPESKIFADFIHLGGPQSSMSEMMALTPCADPKIR